MEGELNLEELTEQEMEVVMTVFRRFKLWHGCDTKRIEC